MPETGPYATPGFTRGFVFAASGAGYTPVAANAARSLRAVCPHEKIDLFTDSPPESGHPFDRVHSLEKPWFRPKFEALRRSRFELTIYVDNDVIFLADISDVFAVLARHDIVAAHNEYRAGRLSTEIWRTAVPPAFPQINGGLLGVKRSDSTDSFLHTAERAIADGKLSRDQGVLRELLWDGNLSLGILPNEYNLMRYEQIDGMRGYFCAPRVMHLRELQAHLRDSAEPEASLRKIVGARRMRRVQHLLNRDLTLKGRPKQAVYHHRFRDRLRDSLRRRLAFRSQKP